jgi:2'-5' RNA ligase
MDTSRTMEETAIVIVPPRDICGFADGYRSRYMPDAVGRIPPHITVAVPFVPFDELDNALPRLARALTGTGPVVAALRGFATFPDSGILYMYLAHPERVLEIYRRVHAEFPEYPAYGGAHGTDLIPHLTVGVFSDPEELQQAYEGLANQRLFLAWDVEAVQVVYGTQSGEAHIYAEISLLGDAEGAGIDR